MENIVLIPTILVYFGMVFVRLNGYLCAYDATKIVNLVLTDNHY